MLQSSQSNMAELHGVSQGLHIIDGHLCNLRTKIKFLLVVKKSLDQIQGIPVTITPMSESLFYLDSRAILMKDWTESCSKRVSVRIGLFYHTTNLWVANLTKSVSEAAQKDSSSMITSALRSVDVRCTDSNPIEWPL